MSNFNGTARSNYFLVKDEPTFRSWAAALGLRVIESDFETPAGRLAMLGIVSEDTDDGCFPSTKPHHHDDDVEFDGTDQVDEDIDIAQELAIHLQDGQVAVLMEAGAEKTRYISGWALAVHSDGRTVQVTLNDIYALAEAAFGVSPITASY